MNYELAKELKDNGFIPPHGHQCGVTPCFRGSDVDVCVPTLPELIKACEKGFDELKYGRRGKEDTWMCNTNFNGCNNIISYWQSEGSTPEEAVARLWLDLNKKSLSTPVS